MVRTMTPCVNRKTASLGLRPGLVPASAASQGSRLRACSAFLNFAPWTLSCFLMVSFSAPSPWLSCQGPILRWGRLLIFAFPFNHVHVSKTILFFLSFNSHRYLSSASPKADLAQMIRLCPHGAHVLGEYMWNDARHCYDKNIIEVHLVGFSQLTINS